MTEEQLSFPHQPAVPTSSGKSAPIRRAYRWAQAGATGFLAGTFIYTSGQYFGGWLGSELTWGKFAPFAPPALAAAIYLALVAARPVAMAVRGWTRRSPMPLDLGVSVAAATLLVLPRWWPLAIHPPLPLAVQLPEYTGLLALAVLAIRFLIHWRTTPRLPIGQSSSDSLLSRLLLADPFAALSDVGDEDLLDHRPLVELLAKLVQEAGPQALTLGLSGPMGSGKTTILNALDHDLAAKGYIVVRFDAWSFREPDRLISSYLRQLADTLRRAGFFPGLTGRLWRLGVGIASIGSPRIRDGVRDFLGDADRQSTASILTDLRLALTQLAKPVVMVIDDLDRLDRDELQAAFRMVRLLSALPNLIHILAYDRPQLARTLFPMDGSTRHSREYLAKIVALEIPVTSLTLSTLNRLLSAALKPIFDVVSEDAARSFIEQLNRYPRQLLVDALATPRETQRAAGMTALLWSSLSRDTNLYDLFILQIIHLRYPELFAAVHAHPDWFTEWGDNIWRISEKPKWDIDRKAFLDAYRVSDPNESGVALRLLGTILPSADGLPAGGGLAEAVARTERRLRHHLVFPRYFRFAVQRELVAESSMEDLANTVIQAPAGAREAIVDAAIKDSVRNGRASDFFDQWSVLVAVLAAGHVIQDEQLATEVVSAVARNSADFHGEWDNPLNARRGAARSILQLLESIPDNAVASRLVAHAIGAATSLDLAGDLTFYTAIAEEARRIPTGRTLDVRLIRAAFDQVVRERIVEGGQNVLNGEDGDVAAVIYRTLDPALAKTAIGWSLAKDYSRLARILRIAVKLEPNAGDEAPSVFHDGLTELANRIDLVALNTATRHLPTEYWTDPIDRATVQFFRKRMLSLATTKGGEPNTAPIQAASGQESEE